jgi:hypothetical protein
LNNTKGKEIVIAKQPLYPVHELKRYCLSTLSQNCLTRIRKPVADVLLPTAFGAVFKLGPLWGCEHYLGFVKTAKIEALFRSQMGLFAGLRTDCPLAYVVCSLTISVLLMGLRAICLLF